MTSVLSFEPGGKSASRFSRLLRSPQRTWQFSGKNTVRLGNWVSRGLGAIRGNYVWQQAVTAYGRARGRIAADNFLILSACRSGTTAMTDYLNCHPRIRCRGEILNRDYYWYGDPRGMNHRRLKRHVESFFVKPPGLMAGAKFLTYQLDELPIGLADLIDLLHRPRIVVLYREQILEQYTSLKLAERSGVGHGNKPLQAEPIWLDPDDFVAFAERERRMWKENLAVLQASDAHFATYGQLCHGPRDVMRGVFEFLGLNDCPVESFVVKLHDRPLSQKLANYQDFVKSGIAADAVLQLPFLGAADRLRAA